MSVTLQPDGTLAVRPGKVELGQGLHTALAQIVADAAGVEVAQVRLLPVDTDHSADEGVTSGSLSVQQAGPVLARAAAAARPGAGRVHEVGRSVPRPELPALFAGAAHFVHDLAPAGLLHGRVLHPPRLGAEVAAFDAAALAGLRWHRDGRLFAVVADDGAAADAAFARLQAAVQWQSPPDEADDAATLRQRPAVTRTVHAAGTPPATVARRLAAQYRKPWIAHASIGPSCALAQWNDAGTALHVFSHTQGPFNLRRDLALAFGLPEAAVRVTHVPGAGCYGHNGADDVAFDAAWLARQHPGRPVRVLWSRADELTLSPQGPAMAIDLEAALDAEGRLVHWRHDVWSPGHSRRPGRSATPALLGAWQVAAACEPPPSIDMPLSVGGGAERNAVPGYEIAAVEVRCHSVVTARRSSALRSLGAFGNVFAAESFVDELAQAAGTDPLAFRQRHLAHDARGAAVLQAAAERFGWAGRTRAEGTGHGLGFARYKNTGAWCAVAAEVHAGERLRVRRLVIAVDVGTAVNPDGVVAQVEGGAIQATSWALLESAAPAHAGWDDYPVLRFADVPEIDVHVMPSGEPSLGAGEASLGPTAAAIANALFDALGVRVRELPLTPERIVAAMGDPGNETP